MPTEVLPQALSGLAVVVEAALEEVEAAVEEVETERLSYATDSATSLSRPCANRTSWDNTSYKTVRHEEQCTIYSIPALVRHGCATDRVEKVMLHKTLHLEAPYGFRTCKTY